MKKDHSLKSVFWADGRSISSYLQFSDVVSFDVTYRTNKFSLPFAPFTGVNHHRQSILFGCALLANEKEKSFIWLFQEWKKCMCGKDPGVIITDQDHAICNAIKKVFPNTRHRFCSWHIEKHITERLHLLRSSNQAFCDEYKAWFYSETILESESRWELLKKKYDLNNNIWLMNLYEMRHQWVPAYFRDIFTAGMTSTQRSESINSFFDGFVHALTPLNEFVTQYENVLVSCRQAEKEEDLKTKFSPDIRD